jgi:hypothetical protein
MLVNQQSTFLSHDEGNFHVTTGIYKVEAELRNYEMMKLGYQEQTMQCDCTDLKLRRMKKR